MTQLTRFTMLLKMTLNRQVLFVIIFSFCCSLGFGQITLGTMTTTKGDPAEEYVKKGYKRYLVEKGMRVVVWEGMGATIDTIFWDQWGFREATYKYNKKKALKGNKGLTPNEIQFVDGANGYNYNPETGVYSQLNNPFVKAVEDLGEGDYIEGEEKFVTEYMGGEYLGEETVDGKTCKVYEVLFAKTWVWEGFAWKSEGKILGLKSASQTTLFEDSFQAPEARLTLPEGAKTMFEAMGIEPGEE